MSDEHTAVTTLTPVTILEQAVKTGANVDVIEKLMGLQERWERHQAEKAFRAALSEAKADFPEVLKTGKVDQGKGRPSYKYEKLGNICAAVDEPLHGRGLYYNWRTESEANGRVKVTCILSHEQGFSEESFLTAPPDTTGAKNPVQSIGSTVTYLKRYTLEAALGITATEDDDGRGGGTESEPPIDLPIDSERAKIIRRLTAEANLQEESLGRILRTINASRIEEISEAHYDRVVDYLERVRAANQKKQQQEEPGADEPDA
jgi:hypothetical protein